MRGRRVRSARRLGLPLALAVLAATVGLLLPSTASEVAAATPDLTIVTAARYDVVPARHLVHVTLDATAVNHKSDTVTRRYYYDSATIAVLPGTRAFSATASGAKPSVAIVRSTSDYRLIRVNFGRRVYSHQTYRFRVAFDLPDPGGAPTRDIRIGDALVSFPVWAFATSGTAGSSVTVVFPADYSVSLDQGTLTGPTRSGSTQTFTATGIANATSFFAFVSADRPGAYAERDVSTNVGGRTVQLAIRPWSDDAAWGSKVGDLFVRGLPVLGLLIAVPYPRTDRLVVQEAVTRSTGGYAGLFDPSTGRIEVAYYATPFVVLHEATHAWFNGALLADRWADEAFASYYAELAAKQLRIAVTPPELTKDLAGARIALNDWQAVGRADTKTETYAYAATLALARLIAQRAGPAGLRSVWAAAAAGEAADQPVHTVAARPERADGPPDWRGLLDLLETRTGQRYDDLWRDWVVTTSERALLDRRATVRAQYAETVRAAGDWELPSIVRRALDAWQFDQASALLAQAQDALGRRAALEQAASGAGLTLPNAVEAAFEGDAGFGAADREADAEIAAIRTIQAAASVRPAQPDLVTRLGLFGTDPDAELAAARAAFSADRLADAVASAEEARATWSAAGDVGRGLLLRIVVGGVIVVLLLALALTTLRRRRASRRLRDRPTLDASPGPSGPA